MKYLLDRIRDLAKQAGCRIEAQGNSSRKYRGPTYIVLRGDVELARGSKEAIHNFLTEEVNQ